MACLQERDETVRFVTEEVDRLKDMFQERETQLLSERDEATASCQEASTRRKDLERDLEATKLSLAAVSSEAEVEDLIMLSTHRLFNAASPILGLSVLQSDFDVV